MLLSPSHFDWAKQFLASQTWDLLLSCADLSDTMVFAIPVKCPTSSELVCSGFLVEQDNLEVKNSPALNVIASNAHDDSTMLPPIPVNNSPLVDTTVRRSPRIRKIDGGFKHKSCIEKNCLACVDVPHQVPSATLKLIAEEVCKTPSDAVSDQALNAKNKRKLPIGEKPTLKKANSKLKGQEKAKKKDGGGKNPSNDDNEA